MTDTTKLAERIAAVHSFPGPYTFKIVAPSSPDLEAQVRAALDSVVPPGAYSMTRRESSGGRYLAVTVEAQVPDVDSVVTLYERLGRIRGLSHLF